MPETRKRLVAALMLLLWVADQVSDVVYLSIFLDG